MEAEQRTPPRLAGERIAGHAALPATTAFPRSEELAVGAVVKYYFTQVTEAGLTGAAEW